jgi:hypothetical protein
VEALSLGEKAMAITATFALPVALDHPNNLGVSVFNSEVTSIAIPTVPLRIFDPQVEIAKDPRVEVEVKPTS